MAGAGGIPMLRITIPSREAHWQAFHIICAGIEIVINLRDFSVKRNAGA